MVVIGVAKGTNRGKKSTKHARKFWFLYEIDSEYRIRKSKIPAWKVLYYKIICKKKTSQICPHCKKSYTILKKDKDQELVCLCQNT